MVSFTVLVIAASVLVQTYGFGVRPKLDGRIVGGENADIADYPYQLSLQYYRSHFCGASIISNNVALTAAHCTDAYSTNLNVRAGSIYTGTDGESLLVAKVNQHPNYDASSIDYDVSVLNLASSFSLGSAINLQPSGNDVPVGVMAVVTGWGALFQGGPNPYQLQQVQVAHVSDSDCKNAYGSITARMTCYSSPGKDSCQGDSGGPLAYNGNQVGIVSWGYGCAQPRYPGVYAKVSNEEINQYIHDHM